MTLSQPQKPLGQKKLWIYDYRINVHKTLKQNRLSATDFEEFIKLFKAEDTSKRKATYSDKKQDGCWRSYTYKEIAARDKINLDIFWLKDESLENTENLPAPEVLASEIVEQLESALVEFRSVEEILTTDKL